MGLLRFLSLPVDDVWFSAILLILVRRGGERMGKDGKGGGGGQVGVSCLSDLDCYQLFQCFGFSLENGFGETTLCGQLSVPESPTDGFNPRNLMWESGWFHY